MYFGVYSNKKIPILSDGATFVLLSLLVNGPSYGYKILNDVKYISNYGCDMISATLYKTLDRFVFQALIDVSNNFEDVKIYSINQKGISALYQQYSRIRSQYKILEEYLEKYKMH